MHMRTTRALSLLGAAALFFGVPAAAAKDFAPGDLRLCNATRCAPITDRGVMRTLSTFYYSADPLRVAAKPRLGWAYLQLRFRNGYVTGIVAGRNLDRFLSYGVYLERFQRGSWYTFPASAARELRRLAGTGIAPLRLTREAIARSR
jgi:hypothetical protein